MRVAVLQYNPLFGEKEKNLNRVEKMLQPGSFHLVVLPELFATGYLFASKKEVASLAEEIPDGKTSQTILRICKEKKTHAAFGILEKSGKRTYNSAVLIGPGGVISHYRKIHLFYEEKRWFTPGDIPLSVSKVGTARVGLMICFDWRFPETARALAIKGADLILHPSNLVLPHCPDAMITRSLENGIFCITADRTGTEKRNGKSFTYIGQSQIVDPKGNVLLRLGKTEEKVATAEIDPVLSRKKKINRYNDLIKDRRPGFYYDARASE